MNLTDLSARCAWLFCANLINPEQENPFCSDACLTEWWQREIDLEADHETHWTELGVA